jgi:hypothetical protein
LKIRTLNGTCDVSAGVRWRDWLVVASDEDNVLRAYRGHDPDPVELIDLSEVLEVERREPETDLEGAATADGITYWIGSHGRSRKGKRRRSRERFFATRLVEGSGGQPLVQIVGRPYFRLRAALRDSVAGEEADLRAAARRAPEDKGGFSIEGIVFRGAEMLVAFRNPNPDGRALLVPFQNPRQVLEGDAAPVLGAPIYIDLGGRGVRALDAVAGGFVIVAGPYNDSGDFALYFWTGQAGDTAREIEVEDPQWRELNPEEVLVEPDAGTWRLTVLSDDGGRRIGKRLKCKDAKPSRRCFRVAEFTVHAVRTGLSGS